MNNRKSLKESSLDVINHKIAVNKRHSLFFQNIYNNNYKATITSKSDNDYVILDCILSIANTADPKNLTNNNHYFYPTLPQAGDGDYDTIKILLINAYEHFYALGHVSYRPDYNARGEHEYVLDPSLNTDPNGFYIAFIRDLVKSIQDFIKTHNVLAVERSAKIKDAAMSCMILQRALTLNNTPIPPEILLKIIEDIYPYERDTESKKQHFANSVVGFYQKNFENKQVAQENTNTNSVLSKLSFCSIV